MRKVTVSGKRLLVAAVFGGMLILIAVAAATWTRPAKEGSAAPPSTAQAGGERGAQAAAQAAPAAPAVPATASVQREDEESRAMAEPFQTGELPEPLTAPRGNPDAAAATLAAFIAARDEQSVPALLTAIMTAGFAVRHEDGRIARTVTPGQGLVFDAWEVAAMAKMYRERRTMALTRLSDDLTVIPLLAGVPFGKLLLQGITQHANGAQPELRFWARLIVELGRRADEPYDLLGAIDAAAVQLDPIQTALMLRRLFGDFAAAGRAGASAARSRGGEPAVMRTLLRRTAGVVPATWRAAPLDPCSALGQGDTATILDAAAVATGTGWGAVLEAVSQVTGDAADLYAKFLNIANTLLAYAKLLATYASIDTTISMENPPLVRTTNAAAGERRQLTATVTMDSGGSDRYNCVRTALNVATGIDFSLIGDGPLKDVELTWRVTNPEGGQVVGVTTGGPRIQDQGTYAGVGGEGTAVGDLTRSVTDDKGQARIYLEGTPRVPYLPQPHMPVMKEAVIRTNLKLKGGDVKGDAVDIAGQALGGVGALVTLPVELLYRVPWATVGRGVAQVKDWETCTANEWYGSITSTTRFERSSVRYGETSEVVIKHESRYRHDTTVNVAGEVATATISSEELVTLDQKSGYGTITSRNESEGRYSGPVNVSVSVNAQQGTYDVGFERPDLTGTTRTSGTCQRPAPYKCQPPTPTARPWDGDGRYLSSVSGKVDPSNPTVIRDSQTFDRRSGIEHTITVNLQRCR